MREPRPELVDIARWAGGDPAALHFSENDEVLLEPGHLVAGNPNRSGTGRVKLRPDLEWQEQLSRSDRWKSTLTALPMLRHYRYPVLL